MIRDVRVWPHSTFSEHCLLQMWVQMELMTTLDSLNSSNFVSSCVAHIRMRRRIRIRIIRIINFDITF